MTQDKSKRTTKIVVIALAILGGILPIVALQTGTADRIARVDDILAVSPTCRTTAVDQADVEVPYRESPALEQWTVVFTGFVVKPFYTALSLVIIILLWRRRESDLTALRWAMIAFFVGENFCAANYLFFGDQSHLFEFLHCYGMVLCFGLTVYAIFDGFDRRILKLSDPNARCAALKLCTRCIKNEDVPCGLRRMFHLILPAAIILACMPLFARPVMVSYDTTVVGTVYNYSHPLVYQIFEIRYLPVAAVVLLSIGWTFLIACREQGIYWSKLFFAAGSGALGFSFFRLLLLHVYRDDLVWFVAWEEITELMFIVGTLATLWIFRDSLFRSVTKEQS